MLYKRYIYLEYVYLVDVCGIIYSPGDYIYNPAYLMYKQRIKSRRQILKHSIVLDRFIRQINT